MQDDDYAPLAKNDYLEDGSESSESSATAASRPSSRWKKFRPWLLHGSLILVYTLITLAGLSSMSRNCNPEPKKWESNERNEIFCKYPTRSKKALSNAE